MVASTVTVEIAVFMVIPTMVVFDASMLAFPVSCVVHAAFIMRNDPVGSRIWRPCPIAGMPSIGSSDGIPVSVNPKELRPRSYGYNANDTRRGRWANLDPYRNLLSKG
jgi:hypothetical protein